jgi:hypothetical protein
MGKRQGFVVMEAKSLITSYVMIFECGANLTLFSKAALSLGRIAKRCAVWVCGEDSMDSV